MYVHLINDEKFLLPFMRRAKKVHNDQLYIVFGPRAPYNFLGGSERIIHVSEWDSYLNIHKINVERIYIHLMTYQKIKWVKSIPEAPVFWLFYGNDLYELLLAFKDFKLYEKEDSPKGLLVNIKGATLINRLQRLLKLIIYHSHYKPFINNHINYWCFWNPGDFELLTKYYHFQGKMLKFQYGAFNPEDIEWVKHWVKRHNNNSSNQILLNHSGSQSGNHKHLLKILAEIGVNQPVISPLSYGDQSHIATTIKYGNEVLGSSFQPVLKYMDRRAYFELICNSGYAIFGHRRQEAGNTLFISLMSGTKVFLHPESVLLPYLIEQGYDFFTWQELSAEALTNPLTAEGKSKNYELAISQFSEQTIAENYQRLLG
jgi:hypothetical protein